MRSILEGFAYGNISPEAQTFKPGSQYAQAIRAAASNEEKLLAKLSDEEKLIFQKFIDAQGEINSLTAVKNFVYGYKLSLLMTTEAFITSGTIVGEDE